MIIRNLLISLLLSLIAYVGHSQILEPAKWSYDISKDNPAVGDEIDLIFYSKIDEDWYLYSTDFDPDLGPLVTEFTFESHGSYELIGGIKPIGSKKKYDEIWEGEYTYFKKKAEFRQTIKVLNEDFLVKSSYEYQVCSDIDGKCIPFDDEFTFGNANQTQDGTKSFTQVPGNAINSSDLGIEIIDDKEKDSEGRNSLLMSRNTNDPYSLLSFMIVAFLAGLAALLTPCVFPMIPMTVTFFTGKSGGKGKAVFYGFSIILIYTLVGSILAPFMGPEIANDLATGWLPNIIFFLVFVIFALSFFGLFEITLPHQFVNRMDRQSDRGGLIGVFLWLSPWYLYRFHVLGQ